MKKAIFYTLFFMSTSLMAQSTIRGLQVSNTIDGLYSGLNARGELINNPNDDTYDGSPLLSSEKHNVLTIYSKDNKVFTFSQGNYNTKEDKFVVWLSKDSIYQFSNSEIDSATINDLKFKRIKSQNDERNYAILAETNSFSVVKGYFFSTLEADINPLTGKRLSKDKIVVKESVFIYKNGNLEEFKLSKKNVLKLMSNKRKEIQGYVAKNKLSYKSDRDLKRIFKYYDSL